MARPTEFDANAAVLRALDVFRRRGYAGATLDELTAAMNISRSSFYNTYKDKKKLYLMALKQNYRQRYEQHLWQLRAGGPDVMAQIVGIVEGLARDHARSDKIGYMDFDAISEFGDSDPDVNSLRNEHEKALLALINSNLAEAKRLGIIHVGTNLWAASDFIQIFIHGVRLAGRAGMSEERLLAAADQLNVAFKYHINSLFRRRF